MQIDAERCTKRRGQAAEDPQNGLRGFRDGLGRFHLAVAAFLRCPKRVRVPLLRRRGLRALRWHRRRAARRAGGTAGVLTAGLLEAQLHAGDLLVFARAGSQALRARAQALGQGGESQGARAA